MLPGVELARRRRMHYHGDAASSSAAAADHHFAHAHHAGAAAVAGPALAARARLEEKLRGAAPPSRWSRLMGERVGRATSGRRNRQEQQQQQEQVEREILPTAGGAAELWPPTAPASASTGGRRRAELTRTLSIADLCAVCLDEVRERQQRVTRLPCSHKYHSECVLPWLAIQPDCPCCRALVPSTMDTLA